MSAGQSARQLLCTFDEAAVQGMPDDGSAWRQGLVSDSPVAQWNEEVTHQERFEFGRNWQSFLSFLDEDRIAEAERSLKSMMGVESLVGRTFLDIGSGSGLFSLAAMRLNARRVHSFDYDPQSVSCTRELKRRYFQAAEKWTIEQGDVLDAAYMCTLGEWDNVYCWGVLHHSGNMWQALENTTRLVKESGTLFISIYNDQGFRSVAWRGVKALHNRGRTGRWLILAVFIPYFLLRGLAVDAIRLRNPAARFREYKKMRGMSVIHDWLDWLGGYPFEVAKPEEVFDFCRERGFSLEKLRTAGGGLGCNEFVLRKR